MKKRTGIAIATAVAGMFIAGNVLAEAAKGGTAAPPPAPVKKVVCEGANSCKGKGACKGMGNACAGKNGCKGKGMSEVASEAECTKAGGKVHKS